MTRFVRRRIPALKMRRSYTSATGLTLRGQVHIEVFIEARCFSENIRSGFLVLFDSKSSHCYVYHVTFYFI